MNHRQATIQAIRDLARDCARGGVYSGHEVARALEDIAGLVEKIPEPDRPDIRPASELTGPVPGKGSPCPCCGQKVVLREGRLQHAEKGNSAVDAVVAAKGEG